MKFEKHLNYSTCSKLKYLSRCTGKSTEELIEELVSDYYNKCSTASIESSSDHELRKAFEKIFIKDGELTESGYLFIKHYYLEAAKNIVKIVLGSK